MPKSLNHCRCCVIELPSFEANAHHQSSHVSTIINSSMAGRMYSSVSSASVTACSSNWGNFLWLTGCCKCLVGFLCLHLQTVFFSDIVNWIPALIDERTTTTSAVRQTQRERERERERESSISEVGQWTFLLLQHDSRDRIRSFFFCPPGKINQSKAQYIIFKLFFLLLLLLLLLLPPIMYMVSAWFFLVFLPHWLCAHSDPIHVKRNINFWKPKFGSNPKLTSPHHIQTANLQSEPKSIIFGWNLWSSNY
jgi:hypothetical protein